MRILVSFSGGRTSAYMSWMMKQKYREHKLVFVFANTGQEHEKTLEFVDRCDREWDLGVVWVEAVVNVENQKVTTHQIVDFNSACRDGRLFEDVCRKYGLPNKSYPHCTRELKLRPIKSYMNDSGDYKTAVGIRADEYRRVRKGQGEIIYPLVDRCIDKSYIMAFWKKQVFDLGLDDYQGNCTWCWKKSETKLFQLMDDNPNAFDTPRILEGKFSTAGNGSDIRDHGWRQIFRGNRTVSDMWRDRMLKHIKMTEPDDTEDIGCASSCEVFDIE